MATAPDPNSTTLVQVRTTPLPADLKGRLAEIGKALGDPQRVEILHLLSVADGAVCVLDLEHHLGLAQSTVSHHLKALVDAGICNRQPRGRWTYYTARPEILAEFRHQLERLIHLPSQLEER